MVYCGCGTSGGKLRWAFAAICVLLGAILLALACKEVIADRCTVCEVTEADVPIRCEQGIPDLTLPHGIHHKADGVGALPYQQESLCIRSQYAFVATVVVVVCTTWLCTAHCVGVLMHNAM